VANFVAFQGVKINDSFVSEFVTAPSVDADSAERLGGSTVTRPQQTREQARKQIEAYFSVADSSFKSE
jgi:hypothetical protein